MTQPTDTPDPVYQHLAHEVSLYSGKTRAYLRYKKIPFKEQISLGIHNRIKAEVGRKIVPVVVTPEGEYLQDSTVIIDRLARDPYPKQLMQRIAPNVYAWTQRMQHPSGDDGEFLPDDEIPTTLYPILQRMFKEQFPPLIDTLHKVGDWVKENPDKKVLPRYVGRHEFRLGSAVAKRCVIPFQQWMLQRPLTFYQSLGADDKLRLDPLLKELGGYEGLQEVIPVALDYEDHQVVVRGQV